MEAYRDQYARIFRNGRRVALIGISPDTPEELASWASDADFPFMFASDATGASIEAFGGEIRDNGMTLERAVVVIDPEGRIHRWMTPFREIDPTSYDELQAAVAEVAPPIEDADGAGEIEDTIEELRLLEEGDCD